MDAPVVGKRRVDVRSVGHLQAHPEDVSVVQSIDVAIHLDTPPFLRVYCANSLPQSERKLGVDWEVELPNQQGNRI
jgi:hypothetical protein